MSNIFNGCRRRYLTSLKELTLVKLVTRVGKYDNIYGETAEIFFIL